MKVLLHEDVSGLGYVGDVVEVSQGYARNYLIPHKLAVTPTESNIKSIEKERVRQAELRDLERKALLKVAEKVNGAQVIIKALANEQGHLFGSVSAEDVAEVLREQGFEVKNKQVILKDHVQLLGTYTVKLHFSADIEAEVKVGIIRPEEEGDDGGTEPEAESE